MEPNGPVLPLVGRASLPLCLHPAYPRHPLDRAPNLRVRTDLCGKGVDHMARIVNALAAIASLFLVAGASARY